MPTDSIDSTIPGYHEPPEAPHCGDCESYGAKDDENGTPCSYCFRHEAHVCIMGACPDLRERGAASG